MGRENAERESDLAQRYRDGDRAAGGELVRLLEPWLRAEVRRYGRMGLDREDVRQEGRVAVLKAARAYDASKGNFRPYAGRVVHREVLRAIFATGTLVILPARVYEASLKRLRSGDALSGKTADAMRVRFADADGTASLNGPDPEALGDVLAHHEPSAEDQLIERQEQAWLVASVCRGLARVSPEQRDALTRRRLGEEPQTIAEAAAAMGVSQEALCHLDVTARHKLRRVLNAAFADDERAWWTRSRKLTKPVAMAAE